MIDQIEQIMKKDKETFCEFLTCLYNKGLAHIICEYKDDNNFWFPSDTPDALNELPDLNVSNDDLFANNNVADLEFPDLNMDFPNIDTEEKI